MSYSTRGLLSASVFLIALMFTIPAESRAPEPRKEITVKIRNGRTGLPVWLASPCVYVGQFDLAKRDEACRRTKFWGDAKVDVTGADPRQVTVVLDFIHRDCKYKDSDGSMEAVGDFDLGAILTKGLGAPNLCSTRTERPKPGVLVMYVIPSSFKEIWSR